MDHARRLYLRDQRRQLSLSVSQLFQERAYRARVTRRARGHLRQLKPVALICPRWTQPLSFLEDLSLELEAGRPAIRCRTLPLRSLMGRPVPEAWNFLLRVLGQLRAQNWEEIPVPMVADRRGFQHAATMLLEEAHAESVGLVALLLNGTEHLPIEVLEDFIKVWLEYFRQHSADRRCTLLLAGTVASPLFEEQEATVLELSDYAEAEAAARMFLTIGQAPNHDVLRMAARFAGGVPALLEAIATNVTERGAMPGTQEELLRSLGGVADELRAAILSAQAQPDIGERLFTLMDGQPRPEIAELDRPLMLSGLVRRAREVGPGQVVLRCPAISALA